MHNKLCHIILASLLTTSFSSCKSQSTREWNTGMEIRTYHGGGMRPESQTVIINNTSGMYIHWNMPRTDTFRFKLSQQELNGIVEQVNKTKFQSIRSGKNEHLVHDMPTTSIEFINGKKEYKVSVGATSEIKYGDPKAFRALYDYILNLAIKKSPNPID